MCAAYACDVHWLVEAKNRQLKKGWLHNATLACGIAVVALVVAISRIHVPGADACQGRNVTPAEVSQRTTLWVFAMMAAFAGFGLCVAGLRKKRWGYTWAIVGFGLAIPAVGVLWLGLDPCGLS